MRETSLKEAPPWLGHATLGVFAVLLFILPIPGTIGLRHSLLLGLVVLLGVRFRYAVPKAAGGMAPVLVALLVLTAWLLFQSAFISPETTWAWREIKSQWFPAILAFSCGVLLLRSGGDGRRFVTASILALLLQCLFALLVNLPEFLAHGTFPQSATRWTAGKLEISYANNLLLAFLAVDLVFRSFYRCRVSHLPTLMLIAGVAVVIVSNIAYGARNGVLGSVLLLGSLSLVVLWRERKCFEGRRVLGALLLCVTLIGTIGWTSYRLDDRWHKFHETLFVGWDIDASKTWLDAGRYPYPSLANGDQVDPSAYVRIAWIHAGLRMVAEYPLGVGYGRNAFGHALRRTEETRLGHAHSGIIDLAVGAGIPGLLLWLAFVGLSLAAGWRRYRDQSDPNGLILFFVTAGFFGRMLLDSINRDHMLVMFFLLLGTLLPIMTDNAPGKIDE